MSQRLTICIANLGVGGAQRAMIALANSLSHKGWAVDLIVFRSIGSYATTLEPSIVVHETGKNLLCFLARVRQHSVRNVSTVYLITQRNVVGPFCFAKRFGLIKQTLVLREANRLDDMVRGFSGWTRQWLFRWLYRSCGSFIALSEATQNDIIWLLKMPSVKPVVIPNAVDVESLKTKASATNNHDWLGEDRLCPVILGVGRLVEQKAFDVLISAVSLVRKKTRVRLLIIGEGNLEGKLRQQARDLGLGEDFDLPGFQDNPYSFMARADAFVLSSRWEGSPNALLEAMAAGAPVIACDCPSGPREILVSEELGKLCPVDDPEALAQAILSTLANPGDAQARQNHIRKNHGTAAWTDAYIRAILGN